MYTQVAKTKQTAVTSKYIFPQTFKQNDLVTCIEHNKGNNTSIADVYMTS